MQIKVSPKEFNFFIPSTHLLHLQTGTYVTHFTVQLFNKYKKKIHIKTSQNLKYVNFVGKLGNVLNRVEETLKL